RGRRPLVSFSTEYSQVPRAPSRAHAGAFSGPSCQRAVGRRKGCVKLTARISFGALFMQIEERKIGDVVVPDLKGRVMLGEGDELLKDKVNSILSQGLKKIVLNLAEVPYIDSAGLGEIVRTFTTVSRQGGSLKLLNLTKRITDLLSITKLLTVFDTFDSET